MGPLARLISLILTRFLLVVVPQFSKDRKKTKKTCDAEFSHLNYRYRNSMLICVIIGLIMIPFSYFGETTSDKIVLFITFIICFLAPFYLFLLWRNQRFVLYRDYFEYYNMFSKKKNIKYADCTYKKKKKTCKLYHNNKYLCSITYDKLKIVERIDKAKNANTKI